MIETSDNPLHSYVSALEVGADPKKVVATIEELMRHPAQSRKQD